MEVIQGRIDCMPEETGYDGSRLEVLNRHLSGLIEKEIIHGAVYTISHKGKIIANASLGKGSSIDDTLAMQPDTIFSIASITKPIAAIALMQLVEDGKIRLDSLVGDIIPQFQNPPFDRIRIHHLLTHTAAIATDGGCFPDIFPKDPWDLMAEGSKLWNGEGEFDWISAGLSGGMRGEIETRWQYSSFGFLIVGEIISRVSGQFANDYITDHIIRPLGMHDSAFRLNAEQARRAYVFSERHRTHLDNIIAGKPDTRNGFWRKLPGTAGGLDSTTTDLIRIAHMMLGNGRLGDVRILGRKAVEKMTTRQLHNVPDYCWGANEPDRGYGLGFDMREGYAHTYSSGTFMHEGSGTCSIDIDPKEQLAAAWFAPFHKVDWAPEPLYNVQNIIWSGLK